MAETTPTSYRTYGPRGIEPGGLSRKRYLKPSPLRLIASGWRPPFGTILPDGRVFDSLGPRLPRSCEPSDAAAADQAIGSCSFQLAGHGDLRIEWGEKDHDKIVKMIQEKMKAGVSFFIIDPASFELVPLKRANRAMGQEVYVHDPDIKKLIEGGFGNFATTRFMGEEEGFKFLGKAKSAEEAARAETLAIQPAGPGQPPEEADILIGADAIAVFLDRELGVRPTSNTRFTRRTVYNWVVKSKLPVRALPNSNTLCASKAYLRLWFNSIGRVRLR